MVGNKYSIFKICVFWNVFLFNAEYKIWDFTSAETNAYTLMSKNNDYADQSGHGHFRNTVKWKAFLEKAKPYRAKSSLKKKKTERSFGTFQ